MSDLSNLRTALMTIVQSLGVSDVSWADEPNAFRAATYCKLTLTSIRGLGRAERRAGEASEDDDYPERVYQPQVLSVSVSLIASAQPLASSAFAAAETVRLGLAGSAAESALNEAGFGVHTLGAITNSTFRDPDGRRMSGASFELLLNGATIVDTGDVPFIKYTVITPTIDEIEGDDIETPPIPPPEPPPDP